MFLLPKRNENVVENYDDDEIDTFELNDLKSAISLETKTLEIEFASLELEILDSPPLMTEFPSQKKH